MPPEHFPDFSKSPTESEVIMTEMVLPQDTNAFGTIFGGKIMSWIDIAGAIAATKHARRGVVTASIDALHFLAPVKVGHFLHIKAQVNFVGRSSMEVGVRVDSENPLTGEKQHHATAYSTFVALDENGKPTFVPPLKLTTQEEKTRFSDGMERRNQRVALAQILKKSHETIEKNLTSLPPEG